MATLWNIYLSPTFNFLAGVLRFYFNMSTHLVFHSSTGPLRLSSVPYFPSTEIMVIMPKHFNFHFTVDNSTLLTASVCIFTHSVPPCLFLNYNLTVIVCWLMIRPQHEAVSSSLDLKLLYHSLKIHIGLHDVTFLFLSLTWEELGLTSGWTLLLNRKKYINYF